MQLIIEGLALAAFGTTVRTTRDPVLKQVVELVMRDEGLCRVGWSNAAASLDQGTDRGGFGFGGTGKRSNDRTFEH
jgi:hypothetical protein